MRTSDIVNRGLIISLLTLLLPLHLSSQLLFSTTPDWISSDRGNFSTGAAWADINQDGWLDLVVANGNDMGRQHVVVYYNDGTGHLQSQPGWQSSDIDYHGHISIGDVNNDGYPDVAVSVYLGENRFSSPGHVKLYLNNNGTLSALPVWRSKEDSFSFSCAFGDADGDGDLDLAVAGGESYTGSAEVNRIFYNHGGILDSLPGWKSANAGFSYDVTWADIDNDGRLDLIFANEEGPNQLYKNYGDSIGTSPFWQSGDASHQANSLFAGDVNNDGFVDLAVSDNNQLGGTGRFKIYKNNGGTLDTLPFWLSSFSGYGSGITLADINHDGKKDLITGGWWNPCWIYVNQGGTFTADAQWQSNVSSVVEAIVCGDVDNDGLDTLTRIIVGDGMKSLFYLPRAPLQRLLSVQINHHPVDRSQYCFDLENGWTSFASVPPAGDTMSIQYVISYDLDFAVSNWDGVGNFLYLNKSQKYVRDTCSVSARWNMVSVPQTVIDFDKNALFPKAISDAFRYRGSGYSQEDTLSKGRCYWLRFPSDTSFPVVGWPILAETLQVDQGWNMIGSISKPVAVSTITSNPPGLVTSEFYGFSHGYVPIDTIVPWKGYWVRLNRAGSLMLTAEPASSPIASRITIVPTEELPPESPERGVPTLQSSPPRYRLEHNYPNPFNPVTSITFFISKPDFVILKIFDVLGREIATLVNEQKLQGDYTVTWDASHLSSGVYIARFHTPSFSASEKLLLLR